MSDYDYDEQKPKFLARMMPYFAVAEPYLHYNTDKKLKIEVWYIGVLHRLLQAFVVIFVITRQVHGNSWAKTEVPQGTVNAWTSSGNYSSKVVAQDRAYCSYSYYYSKTFQYLNPVCESPHEYKLVSKNPDGGIFITTAYIETHQVAFPCSDAASDWNACDTSLTGRHYDKIDSKYGTYTLSKSADKTQCWCDSEPRTIYPYEVETMFLSFEHTYKTNPKFMGGISGGSNAFAEVDNPLKTRVHFANGKRAEFAPGSSISFSVTDWLLGSEVKGSACSKEIDAKDGVTGDGCRAGVRLDDYNPSAGGADPIIQPHLRTTGVRVNIEVEYENLDENGFAQAHNEDVEATVRPHALVGPWASDGGHHSYVEYPRGSKGQERWVAITRYNQGLTFSFHTVGYLHAFDYFYFINTLVGALVLFGVCRFIVDTIAFNALRNGQSRVYATARFDRVSKKSEFADFAVKTAMAANQFQLLDQDGEGRVRKVNVVKLLAKVPDMTPERAHAIATAIFEAQEEIDHELNFGEFVESQGGSHSTYELFLKNLPDTTSSEDYEYCKEKFLKIRAAYNFSTDGGMKRNSTSGSTVDSWRKKAKAKFFSNGTTIQDNTDVGQVVKDLAFFTKWDKVRAKLPRFERGLGPSSNVPSGLAV